MTEITVSTEDLISVSEAAKRLKVHLATIYRWVEGDRITGIKLGGVLFIPVSEVDRINEKEGR